ncbi:MAG: hypothetical protein A2487_09115 [Candidatus Raymondbacteria bacterium RifOxyC12_full_50_8]|nr:MAG: hypothetical protein A2487_09115 [Candidatus Raymondbacteria bacterium RifOxyC12_full_50_8]
MEIFIVIIFLVILIVITMYIALQKKSGEEDIPLATIHASGIYSVIRKSPRENLHPAKPPASEIAAFVGAAEKDMDGVPLSGADRERIIARWNAGLEDSITAVEKGDREGVQRFLIKKGPVDAVCAIFAKKNYIILREDIYRHPELLPPFFPGCECRLESEAEWQTAVDFEHFRLGEHEQYAIPYWKQVKKVR